ncbi:HEAT repeat domain-containing protein [Oligoflexia bacterium]|nr:HEAT repeat domain-containing protein [Oligoflexia bacterium]
MASSRQNPASSSAGHVSEQRLDPYLPGLDFETFRFEDRRRVYEFDLVADHADLTTDEHLVNLQLLLSEDENDRLHAIFQIVNAKETRALPALAAMAMWDPRMKMRLETIEALGAIADESSVGVLQSFLKDPIPVLMSSAAQLTDISLPRFTRTADTSPAYRTDSEKIMAAAATALEQFKPEHRVDAGTLLKWAHNRTAEILLPETALELLSKRGNLTSREIKTLVGFALRDNSRFWQKKYIETANAVDAKQTEARLRAVLFKGRRSTRTHLAAMDLLRGIHSDEEHYRPRLMAEVLQQHRKWSVREEIVKEATSTDLFLIALADPHHEVRFRASSSFSADVQFTPNQIVTVSSLLMSRDTGVRESVAALLTRIEKNSAFYPTLVHALGDKSVKVRSNAARAFGNCPFEAEQFEEQFFDLLQFGNDHVKLATLSALEAISKDGVPRQQWCEKLRSFIENRSFSVPVRGCAVEALLDISGLHGVQLLRGIQSDVEPDLAEKIELEIDHRRPTQL